jgi:hypothetical protein
MLFIAVRSYREDCEKSKTNFEESLNPYRKSKALVETKKKRMLAGTVANTQAAVVALCFDTTKLEFFNDAVLLKDEDPESPAADPVGQV